jgi:hypothetical protein
MKQTAFDFFPEGVAMNLHTIDPVVVRTVAETVCHHLAPLAAQGWLATRGAIHFCGLAWSGTKAHLHFCLYGGMGLGLLAEAWHDWRGGANHSAREKGLAGAIHWIVAILGP